MQSAAEQAPTHQGAPAGGLTSHPGSLRPTEIPEGPKKINRAWPDLHYQTVTGALVLLPSPPRIPPAQLRLIGE